MATGNAYRNFVKFGHTVFEICTQTDTETCRQTYRDADHKRQN